MHNISSENYLKCIYHLQADNGEPASTNAIAGNIGIKASSVTSMLLKLEKMGLIDYSRYQGASLTREGKRRAIQVVRKHRLWEYFLVQKLGLQWDEVHDIAEQLEHVESELLIDKLDKFLNYPIVDPHGDPIPDHRGKMKATGFVSMDHARPNEEVVIAGVTDHRAELLKHLQNEGLIPGKRVQIHQVTPVDGMITLSILPSKKKQHVSRVIAKSILIQTQK